MALNAPTTDEFLERFPTFEGQDDLIEFLIPEASKSVSESWDTDDQKSAIMYLTAYMVSTESGGAASQSGAIASESFGPMSRSYKVSQSDNPLMNNEYGRRYLAIKRRYLGEGIVVVGGESA